MSRWLRTPFGISCSHMGGNFGTLQPNHSFHATKYFRMSDFDGRQLKVEECLSWSCCHRPGPCGCTPKTCVAEGGLLFYCASKGWDFRHAANLVLQGNEYWILATARRSRDSSEEQSRAFKLNVQILDRNGGVPIRWCHLSHDGWFPAP